MAFASIRLNRPSQASRMPAIRLLSATASSRICSAVFSIASVLICLFPFSDAVIATDVFRSAAMLTMETSRSSPART